MKVRDCITPSVVTIAPEASAKQAFGLMKSMGIRHLVVVKGGVILGIVTDRDLRRPKVSDIFKAWHELYRVSDEFQVEDIMTSPVITVDASADIREAARLLVEHRIGALPVTDAHRGLAGIITEIDLLKALIAAPERAQ
jgi:acetoin utilization protein AcuB